MHISELYAVLMTLKYSRIPKRRKHTLRNTAGGFKKIMILLCVIFCSEAEDFAPFSLYWGRGKEKISLLPGKDVFSLPYFRQETKWAHPFCQSENFKLYQYRTAKPSFFLKREGEETTSAPLYSIPYCWSLNMCKDVLMIDRGTLKIDYSFKIEAREKIVLQADLIGESRSARFPSRIKSFITIRLIK